MNTAGTAPAELRSFVERIQRLEGEIADVNSDKRDVYTEAKSKGFDVAALKAVVAYLRKDREKAEEQRTVFELYLAQVVAPVGTGNATRARARSQLAASTGSPPTRGNEAVPRIPSGAASPNSDEWLVTGRTVTHRDGTTTAPISGDIGGTKPLGQPKGRDADKGGNFSKGQQQRCPGSIPSALSASDVAPAISGSGLSVGHHSVDVQRAQQQETHSNNLVRYDQGVHPAELTVKVNISDLLPQVSSEAAPVLGDIGDRTDATSSHSAADPTRPCSSLANGGGNLAGAIPGHSLSETDAVVLPDSIVEPAVPGVSTPRGEIEPARETGLGAGSPIPDTDPSLDIRNQPFYRGGETWPR